jgi:peptidoglycan-associated lipoprotein
MRLKIFFLPLFLATILLSGCSLKSRIKKADRLFSQGEYFEAGKSYRNVYSTIPINQKPLRARIAFHEGECYRLINYSRAELPYTNAIRYKYADSIVYLRYAQVLQRNGKYGEASKNYTIYLKKDSTSLLAKNGLEACTNVLAWKTKPIRYIIHKADLFNVRSTDNFSPAFLNSDADALIFTSSRQLNKKTVLKSNSITGLPNNNMFMSRKDVKGKWGKPFLLGDEINTIDDDEGVCSFTSDGKIMYFTRSVFTVNGGKGTEIMMSNKAGETWSKPQKIKIFKDSTISVAHPALSPDGQILYFVSDSKKGFGGKDIWKGTLEKGECKYIENLGPEINTPGDEMFPTVSADGTLYFSSNGHAGYGGLDIFQASQRKDGGWTVENVGEPLNSSADDFGMTFAGKSEKGFFTSNRGEQKGYDAIWSFEIPELAYSIEGKVVDEKGTEIPDATIRMVSSNGDNARIMTKKDGTYRIKLDKDMDCVMMASARGYLNQNKTFSTKGLTDSKVFKIDFKLATISKLIPIENIFYEFAKWDLTSASEPALQGLVKVLNDNPNITIEISSNTDYIGSNEDNKILSEKRAKSVVDYLISKGIASDRLVSVGNGEEKPVVVDSEMAKKYNFLKENDVLNETFVLKLTPEQQEIVNQINRRSDFRVLKTTYKPNQAVE